LLEDNYVFPDTARRYAAMLQTNLAAGRYTGFLDAGAFAERVTADLQAVARDGHLVLVAPRSDRTSAAAAPSGSPPAIGRSGWIAPGVAYVEFRSFPSDRATLDRLREFLTAHAGARTLIIDTVREHAGGWIGEADLLFSQLYTSPTDLVAIDVRQSVDTRMGGLPVGPSIRKVDSPAGVARYMHSVLPAPNPGLGNARVYVLISNRTISAGEHLAFALQRTRRATLIGETTRGAGNVETDFPLAAGYSAVIPFARAFDPETGEGWERVGVRPDIAVPADDALNEALRRAGVNMSADAALARLR
jgi:C-terminal processing protease CtpA/Prc